MNIEDNLSKNYRDVPYLSRYSAFPYYYDSVNNKYYYGLTAQLDKTAPYALYKVKEGDSYDSIASKHYGSALYYWIICHFNDIFDCTKDPEAGTDLKIPSLNSINFIRR